MIDSSISPKPACPTPRPLGPGEFIKYHALGNDYLVVAQDAQGHAPNTQLCIALCDRHRGVGADGVLVLLPGDAHSDAGLTIYNPDGSVAEKSGNGLRIFARAVFDLGYVTAAQMCLRLEPSGERVQATLLAEAAAPHHVGAIVVAMGRAALTSTAVGMTGVHRDTLHEPLIVAGEHFDATCVSMGNPHCVLFVPELDVAQMRRLGPAIESHPLFARRTNVQFAKVKCRTQIDILIWERGAGETQASGSSSSAVAVAAFCRGLVDRKVEIVSPGGVLNVCLSPELDVRLEGPAALVHRGYAFI